jgi:hypothetical protein
MHDKREATRAAQCRGPLSWQRFPRRRAIGYVTAVALAEALTGFACSHQEEQEEQIATHVGPLERGVPEEFPFEPPSMRNAPTLSDDIVTEIASAALAAGEKLLEARAVQLPETERTIVTATVDSTNEAQFIALDEEGRLVESAVGRPAQSEIRQGEHKEGSIIPEPMVQATIKRGGIDVLPSYLHIWPLAQEGAPHAQATP